MIDFHNHLVPGVDDGAADLDESRTALETFRAQGVHTVITTPHYPASLAARPEALASFFAALDPAWERLRALAAAEFPDLRLERGVEVNLDLPQPDLSDPRLRLAGTRFVLCEFPFMAVPPNSAQVLFDLTILGWTPVVAHPERYGNLDEALHAADEWRRAGARLQVNCGSLLGRYGPQAHRLAWGLLREGWADYLCSDYHARGTCHVAACRAELEKAGGAEQARLLSEENPARLLAGEAPLPVPPLRAEPRPFWRRLLGGGRA
ncbi:MAG TPA: CpsB/CapC family capsule biosynthesis tyrosine phosphatase [Longimicrobiaceae bacterium]|nr:CpsB/CapC family capsule biosynthesis tyrosine phosphatase [Longimicrobiaceae bacterium]